MKAKKPLSVPRAAAMAAGLLVGCGGHLYRRGRFYRGLHLHCCFYRG